MRVRESKGLADQGTGIVAGTDQQHKERVTKREGNSAENPFIDLVRRNQRGLSQLRLQLECHKRFRTELTRVDPSPGDRMIASGNPPE